MKGEKSVPQFIAKAKFKAKQHCSYTMVDQRKFRNNRTAVLQTAHEANHTIIQL